EGAPLRRPPPRIPGGVWEPPNPSVPLKCPVQKHSSMPTLIPLPSVLLPVVASVVIVSPDRYNRVEGQRPFPYHARLSYRHPPLPAALASLATVLHRSWLDHWHP